LNDIVLDIECIVHIIFNTFLFAGKEQEVHPHLAVVEALHAHEAVPGLHGHVLPGDDASLQDPNLAVPEATQDHVPGATLVQGPGTERNGQDFLDPEVDQDLQGGKEDHVVLGLKVIQGHGHHLIPDPKTDGGDLVAEAGPMIDVDGHVLCQAPGSRGRRRSFSRSRSRSRDRNWRRKRSRSRSRSRDRGRRSRSRSRSKDRRRTFRSRSHSRDRYR